MGNMSYCRMQNTFQDLQEVHENWNETESASELKYRQYILGLCRDIISDFDEEGQYISNEDLD